jgi:hypothetical protein
VGATRARFCGTHKETDMVDVRNRCCEEPGCDTVPSFAKPSAKRPRYCSKHKDADMVNVIHPRCVSCIVAGVDPSPLAFHKDADGNKNKLCATCAVAAGVLAKTHAGSSREACEFFNSLEAELGVPLPNRVLLRPGCDPTGVEKAGLIPGHTAMRPDAWIDAGAEAVRFVEELNRRARRSPGSPGYIVPDPSKGIALQYHGKHFHGVPPSHPEHKTGVGVHDQPFTSLYASTCSKDALYVGAGHRLLRVWSDCAKRAKQQAFTSFASAVSEFAVVH